MNLQLNWNINQEIEVNRQKKEILDYVENFGEEHERS